MFKSARIVTSNNSVLKLLFIYTVKNPHTLAHVFLITNMTLIQYDHSTIELIEIFLGSIERLCTKNIFKHFVYKKVYRETRSNTDARMQLVGYNHEGRQQFA